MEEKKNRSPTPSIPVDKKNRLLKPRGSVTDIEDFVDDHMTPLKM